MDHQYLNYNHNLIISPLKKLMNIEIYNDNYFSAKGQNSFTSNSHDKYSSFVDTIASKQQKTTQAITPAAELSRIRKSDPYYRICWSHYSQTTPFSHNQLRQYFIQKVILHSIRPRRYNKTPMVTNTNRHHFYKKYQYELSPRPKIMVCPIRLTPSSLLEKWQTK